MQGDEILIVIEYYGGREGLWFFYIVAQPISILEYSRTFKPCTFMVGFLCRLSLWRHQFIDCHRISWRYIVNANHERYYKHSALLLSLQHVNVILRSDPPRGQQAYRMAMTYRPWKCTIEWVHSTYVLQSDSNQAIFAYGKILTTSGLQLQFVKNVQTTGLLDKWNLVGSEMVLG
jgi:hypothetical protein